jgi:TonB-linked SusC/RagA family outer membrane protein
MKTNLFKFLTLSLMIMFQWSFAQQSVSGTVTDSDGMPLPGATVIVEGTSNGVSTDFDGVYSITANEGDILSFSYVGFETQKIAVGSSATINVSLSSDANLDEVVVTALGIEENKLKLSYSTQQLSESEINISQTTNIRDAIAGKVAGVQGAFQAGSKLGSQGTLYLRGAISLKGRSGVVYVIDGVPSNPDNVDIDNIASINVLKGPNGAALYGLDAADGVVVITTKKGSKNTFKVELSQSITMDEVSNLPTYQNEYGQGYNGEAEWRTFDKDQYPWMDPIFFPLDGQRYIFRSYADESWGPKFDDQPYVAWYNWFPDSPYYGQTSSYSAQPNNVKDFYDDAVTSKTSVTVSGGGEKNTALLSFTRTDQSGLLPYSNLKRDVLKISYDSDLTSKFSFGANVNFTSTEIQGDFDDGYGNQTSGMFNSWFDRGTDMKKVRELKDLTTPDGYNTSWNWWNPLYYSLYDYKKPTFWLNPYTWLENYEQNNEYNTLVGDIHASYDISENLQYNFITSINSYSQNSGYRVPYFLEYSSDPDLYTDWVNSFGETKSNLINTIVRQTLSFNDSYADFDVNALLGFQHKNYDFRRTSANMSLGGNPGGGDQVGLVIPDLYTFANSRQRVNPGLSETRYRTNELFARVSTTYNRFLTLTGDINSTWDSRFDRIGTDASNRNIFGSVGLSFIASEIIDFGDDVDLVKLSSNYAMVGTNVAAYSLNPSYFISGRTYGSKPLQFVASNPVSNDISVAKSNSLEISLNTSFFNNRVSFDATFYDEDRKDEIINADLPSSTGASSLVTNSGLVNRKGIELVLGLNPIKTDDWNWNLNVNFADNTTKVLKIAEGLDSYALATSSFSFVTLTNRVGEEWGQLVGAERNRDANGNLILTDDGLWTVTKGKSLGSVLPDFTGGIFSSLRWKDLTLNTTFTYQKGGKFFSLTENWGTYSGLTINTVGNNDKGNPIRDAVEDGGGVHVTGVTANGTAIDIYQDAVTHFNQQYSNRIADPFIHDASYFKLSELSLNYNVPLNNDVIKGLQLGLIAKNVWLISTSDDNYHNWDPSQFSTQYGENGQLPGTSSIGLNMKLTF